MKKAIFAIFDSKVAVFQNPIYFRNNNEAIRSFESAVNDQGTVFHQFPDDFNLYRLGEFDDEDGSFLPQVPQLLVNAKELLSASA